jgi:hypothetical protein
MPDDSLLWTAKPPAPRQPKPGEHIWALQQGSRYAECKLRFHGESCGWEQFFRDGLFFSGRRFDLKAQALAWAEFERQAMEKEGWSRPDRPLSS